MENKYTLKLCEGELERYKHMAGTAKEGELDSWRKAGVLPGARVADIGCGPGAILVELARLIELGMSPRRPHDGGDGFYHLDQV